MHRWLLTALVLALGACAVFEGPSARYVVFYTEFSAKLDDSAHAVVAAAAAFANRHPEQPVVVSGFADPVGSVEANRDLSRTRAQVVADDMVASGVGVGRIRVLARGEVPFAGSSQESRRVGIVVGNP